MYIEIDCRFSKKISQDDLEFIEEELNNRKITDGDFDYATEKEKMLDEFGDYEYDKMIIATSMVETFNRVDDSFFTVRMTTGAIYIGRGDYNKFKELFQKAAGYVVHEF